MMREAISPVIASSSLLVQDRLLHHRNITTTAPQQRISPPSIPLQMHPSFPPQDMRQVKLVSNQSNAISPYQTPTSSPPSQDLLPQNL